MTTDRDTFSVGGATDELLARPLQYVKGVGPVRAKLLARLNLQTLQDLLFHFPIAHKDRASITPIAKLEVGVEANIVAQVLDVRGQRFKNKEKIEAFLQDESGEIRAGWWNPWVAEKLIPNGWGFFSGKVTQFNKRKEFANAEFEIFSENDECPGDKEQRKAGGTPAVLGESNEESGDKEQRVRPVGPSFGRIVPIYNLRPKQRLPSGEEAPEIRSTQGFLRKIVFQTLEAGAAERLRDQLPESLREKLGLPSLARAIRQFHFPDSFEKLKQARRRLAFEELFIISLGVALRRAQIQKLSVPKKLTLTPVIQKRILARLPFALTPSQTHVFGEIAADLAAPYPMNRLLQGDVGSGKTAVAVAAMLLCVAHGAQAALLAPTEVLAEQHARVFSAMLANSRVKIGLLRGGSAQLYVCSDDASTGSMQSVTLTRDDFLQKLANDDIHIAIGTHALLEEDVKFKRLSLIVVDEQHKFGVSQRHELRRKGVSPHVLVMTATPIPRTLTLTLYGDLDVSRIGEPPPGRGEIITKWVKETEREKVYRLIINESRQGHASYVVMPRIGGEDAIEMDATANSVKTRSSTRLWNEVKSVEEEGKRLQAHLPTLRIDILHGRMSSRDKDAVLTKLRSGKLDVLVSTQVIEVGIDLPTATVMMIENAEMFGLAALHQLRGRIGRSSRKSYCLVFGAPSTDEAHERLKTFVAMRDGFKIAEADFKLRGPGQFFGTQQSGMPELKVADLLRDDDILSLSREQAFELVKRDSTLSQLEHAGLKQRVQEVLGQRLKLIDVG
ncbi:MAG: ATP-dependent DNA helicase RecG [Planctomycetota bacterium]